MTSMYRRAFRWVGTLSLACGSVLAALLVIEATLRAFPFLLPSGAYGAGKFDPELGMNVHGAQVIYKKRRPILREPNSIGFMDVEHSVEKPEDLLRVGFFGDSYVESLQVEVDETFFRRIPERIAGRRIETLGFGLSGWGTLHSFLAYRVYAPRYDLDAVVYVFVENDPANNLYSMRTGGRYSPMPFAVLSAEDPGYAVKYGRSPQDRPLRLKALKAIHRRMLVAQIAQTRLQLLRMQGVRMRASPEDREMTGVASARIDSSDLPLTWPRAYYEEAREVGERILSHWSDLASTAGHHFAILYVPRGGAQLVGELPMEETWFPWLERTSAKLGIPLIDPTEALRARLREGDRVYDDHWSPAGHEVIAEMMTTYLDRWIRESQ